MGTNYYLKREPNVCPACHHDSGPPALHIGKSSGGWCFSLHVEPSDPDHPHDLDEWRKLFKTPGSLIEDEYGEQLTSDKMLQIITERSRPVHEEKPYGYSSWEEFHRRNRSVPGPNGLVRHSADGGHCVGHGSGTWDLITGYFS